MMMCKYPYYGYLQKCMKNYTGTSSHENDANKDDATIIAEVYRTAYAPGGRIILPSKS